MRTWVAGRTAVAAVALAAIVAASCDGAEADEISPEAQVYLAAIRDVVDELPPPTEPDTLPVVYVVAVGETDIAAGVQAEVLGEVNDVVVVRFADARDEALLEQTEGVPVRDAGVLLAVHDFDADADADADDDADPLELEVEVYRSEEDWSTRVLTIARGGGQRTVTASSVLSSSGT